MDVIAAIATGAAPTAIGVVRVSGQGCFDLCAAVFTPALGQSFAALEPRKMTYGSLLDRQGRCIDRGLAVRFPGPHSYTGEDSAEFHCHGSPVVLREVLSALFAAGARQAGPGEFTKRAFLNGRLDLTEAEAVADLIESETAAAARNAAAQLGGSLRRDFEAVYDRLLDMTSQFYAVVDYPDEDIQDLGPAELAASLRDCAAILDRLLATCDRGRVLKSGVRTAIIGRPNAGKSSLLNALAGYERCLVTDIPGTTRDTVEESVLCGGVRLRLTDTAGIRDTADTVERLGVERSRRALESADLILAVIDGSSAPTAEDRAVLDLARKSGAPVIVILSKLDLGAAPDALVDGTGSPSAAIRLSARTGEGISLLEDAVASLFPAGDGADGAVLTNERQQEAALRARRAISRAAEALESGMTPDAVLTDAEEALSALGELTGRTAGEAIVSRIFQRFCVGK